MTAYQNLTKLRREIQQEIDDLKTVLKRQTEHNLAQQQTRKTWLITVEHKIANLVQRHLTVGNNDGF